MSWTCPENSGQPILWPWLISFRNELLWPCHCSMCRFTEGQGESIWGPGRWGPHVWFFVVEYLPRIHPVTMWGGSGCTNLGFRAELFKFKYRSERSFYKPRVWGRQSHRFWFGSAVWLKSLHLLQASQRILRQEAQRKHLETHLECSWLTTDLVGSPWYIQMLIQITFAHKSLPWKPFLK